MLLKAPIKDYATLSLKNVCMFTETLQSDYATPHVMLWFYAVTAKEEEPETFCVCTDVVAG